MILALLLFLSTLPCVECYTSRIVDQYGKVIICEICTELDPTSHSALTSKVTCRPE